MAYERKKKEKMKQKEYYDEKDEVGALEAGDFTLVFWPTLKDK